MSIPVPGLVRFVALLAFAWAGPAAAQSSPDGRAWIDPPAREAAVTPAAPDLATAETPPAAPPAAAPERRAAVSKPPAALKRHAVAAKPHRATAKAPVATIRRRPVVVARSRPGPVRMARTRPPDLRPVRYGFVSPPPFAYDVDPRAQRIRQAEAAGYLVVRRTTLAAPDGRLLYGYRPGAADDFDD